MRILVIDPTENASMPIFCYKKWRWKCFIFCRKAPPYKKDLRGNYYEGTDCRTGFHLLRLSFTVVIPINYKAFPYLDVGIL